MDKDIDKETSETEQRTQDQTHIYGNLTYNRSGITKEWRKDKLLKNGTRSINYLYEKNYIRSMPHNIHKIN